MGRGACAMGVGLLAAAGTVYAAGTEPATRGDAPGAATAAAATEADAGRWRGVLENLASEDFGQRSAAQKELDKATWRDREVLHALAEKSTDTEVKERLAGRVEALDEQMAIDPPPISLDVDNAQLSEMAPALGKAMGLSFQAYNNQPQTYTLHAVDQPFADVFLALIAQGGFQPDFQGRRITPTGRQIHTAVKAGAFVVWPVAMLYQRNRDYQAAAGQPEQETTRFSYAIVADPRLKIVGSVEPTITSVVDDTGDELIKPDPNRIVMPVQRGMMGSNRGAWFFDYSIALAPPAGAKAIASVKGVGHFTLEVGKTSVEVADMVKLGQTPVAIGDREMKFTEFTPNGNVIRFNAQVTQPAAPRGVPVDGRVDRSVNVTLIDANGQVVSSESIAGGWSGSFGGRYVQPIKAIFSITTKTVDVDVPFEFKDLPLP